MNKSFADLCVESIAVAEQLTYIDFKLLFTGFIERSDLMSRFDITNTRASTVISAYKEYRPENVAHRKSLLVTELTIDTYHPLVDIQPEIGLQMLMHGFDSCYFTKTHSTVTSMLCHQPKLDLYRTAAITRALHNHHAISSDLRQQQHQVNCLLYPLALIQENEQWMIRCYNSTLQVYCSLPITTLERVKSHTDIQPESSESLFADPGWQQLSSRHHYFANSMGSCL